jgi:hypothetical protein
MIFNSISEFRLKALLEKDPGRRFQTPAELLKAMPTIADAIGARCRITRQSLQTMPRTDSHTVTRKRLAKGGPEENLSSEVACYRKRCFWPRGGYRFPG